MATKNNLNHQEKNLNLKEIKMAKENNLIIRKKFKFKINQIKKKNNLN